MSTRVENILATGGACFIGSHLVERLLARGNRIIDVDTFKLVYSSQRKKKDTGNVLDNKHCEFAEYDIRNKGNLSRLFRTYKLKGIIHLAARVGVGPSTCAPFFPRI